MVSPAAIEHGNTGWEQQEGETAVALDRMGIWRIFLLQKSWHAMSCADEFEV